MKPKNMHAIVGTIYVLGGPPVGDKDDYWTAMSELSTAIVEKGASVEGIQIVIKTNIDKLPDWFMVWLRGGYCFDTNEAKFGAAPDLNMFLEDMYNVGAVIKQTVWMGRRY